MTDIRRLFQKAGRFVDVTSDALGWLAAAIVVFLSIFVFYGVIMRYVFDSPYKHSDELASYMMVAIVFLGLAYTFKVGGHIRARILSKVISPKVWKLFLFLTAIVGLAWAGFFFYGCFTLWLVFYSQGVVGYGLLHVEQWMPASVLVAGSLMLLLQLLRHLATGEVKEDKSQ